MQQYPHEIYTPREVGREIQEKIFFRVCQHYYKWRSHPSRMGREGKWWTSRGALETYFLSRDLRLPARQVYYHCRRLQRDGLITGTRGRWIPTFATVLEYQELHAHA